MSNLPKQKILTAMEEMLKIVADETRLKILYVLLDEDNKEKCVNEIYSIIGSSQSLTSHQLKVLKNADLVSARKEGTKVYYSLKDEHVYQLVKVVMEHVMEKIS